MASRRLAALVGASVVVLGLTACIDAVPTPVPSFSITPSPSETGFDPTFTESPTPAPTGSVPDLGDRTQVVVLIAYATWSSATSEILAYPFMPGITEAGGECTLTAEKDGLSYSVTAPSDADASSTICGEIALSNSGLTSGKWSVTASYSSAESAGSSGAQEVEIP